MNLELFTRQLQLLEMLTGNTDKTLQDICEQLDLSPRTFHRYVAMFRAAGFEVSSSHTIYTIFFTSPHYANIADKMQLRSSEVNTMADMLSRADITNPAVTTLRRKFSNLYGVDFNQSDAHADQQLQQNTTLLQQAVRHRRQVILHDYESPHRSEASDRLVEPFRMLAATASVRCYEPQTDTCKTFKISRIRGEVQLLDQQWEHQTRHVHYYTDPFGFSGETRRRIILRLTPLAAQVLCEECGVKESQLIIDADNRHRIFSTHVCSPVGAGRFIMGLLNDVEIVQGHDLQTYIHQELQRYGERYAATLSPSQ